MSTTSVKDNFIGFSNTSVKRFVSGTQTMVLVAIVLFLSFDMPHIQAATEKENTTNEPLSVMVFEDGPSDQDKVIAYDPEKLEQACAVTPARIASLISMWIFVLILVVTTQIHLRSERKLMKSGYYDGCSTCPTQRLIH